MNARLLVATILGLSLVAASGAAPASGDVVARATHTASMLDSDGEPEDPRTGTPRPKGGLAEIRALDPLARELDARLRARPQDFDALIARARIERLRSIQASFAAADSYARKMGAPTGAILGSDPRPRIVEWLDRAQAVRPTSGEPAFWTAFMWADPGIAISSMAAGLHVAIDLERSVRAAREAVRLAPQRPFARALLVSDLLGLGLDEEAARVGEGGAPAEAGARQVEELLADRRLFALPQGARYEARLREMFGARDAAGSEDASPQVSAARTACYVLSTDAAGAAAELQQRVPGMQFLHEPADSAIGGLMPFRAAYFSRLRWTLGGQLEPVPIQRDTPIERDAVDIGIVDLDVGDIYGVPRDSLALRQQARAAVLYFVDRKRLAP